MVGAGVEYGGSCVRRGKKDFGYTARCIDGMRYMGYMT
jgi:hypothetical protein